MPDRWETQLSAAYAGYATLKLPPAQESWELVQQLLSSTQWKSQLVRANVHLSTETETLQLRLTNEAYQCELLNWQSYILLTNFLNPKLSFQN